MGKSNSLIEKIPAGEHTLVLNKENLTATQTFRMEPNELLKFNLKLVPAIAELLITSTPFGAQVTLDGKEVGETPLRLKTAPGAHQLIFTLKGHVTHKQQLEALRGQLQP